MTSYVLSKSVYYVLLLHSKKYIHSITGLLLGKKISDRIEITQALPLAHSDLAIHTTPLSETGLHLAEHYATCNALSIVGFYFANDVIDDTALPTHAVRIADLIRKHSADAIILRIDGLKLKSAIRTQEHCLVVYRGEGWKRESVDGLVSAEALSSLDKALGVDGVCDLEDHLLDPRADWLNTRVVQTLGET